MKNLALLLSLVCSTFGLNIATADTHEKTYTIGVVPQFEAVRLRQVWKPIIQQLESRTGYKFELKGAPTIPAFEKEFQQGEFDFAYMNPYHLLMANKAQGYLPLVRDHKRRLQGVLVVRKDSNINSVKDLNNEVLAFPSPKALGASLQMRYELSELHGVKVTPKYVKTHDSVYLNVLLKQAKAGGGVQKTLNKQQPRVKDALKVIYRTQPVAPHPLAAHPRVPEKVSKAVQQAILDMAAEQEGAKILSKIPMPKAGKATLDDYLPLKKMNLERFY